TGDGNPSVGKSQTDRMTAWGAGNEKTKMSKIDRQGKRGRAANRKVRRAARIADAPAIQVTVTFRHVEPTDAIRLYADKVGRQLKKHLEKFKAKKVRSPSTGEVLSASEET